MDITASIVSHGHASEVGQLLSELAALGVFIRMPGVAPLDRCIRISLGDDQTLDILEHALPQARKAAD